MGTFIQQMGLTLQSETDLLQVAFDTINYTWDPWKFITIGLAPKLHSLSSVPPVLKEFNDRFLVL